MIMIVLPYRKPCNEALLAKEGSEQETSLIINSILKNNYNIHYLPSGDASIYMACNILKFYANDLGVETCVNAIIPDMGAWKGFETYAELLDFDINILKTEDGVINPKYLKTFFENLNYEKSNESTPKNILNVLFITSSAGYLQSQNIKEIRNMCNNYNILLFEDISGKVGGDCGYGDIIVCSTGSPKIINCEYGGFLGLSDEFMNLINSSDNSKKIKDNIKKVQKTYKIPNIYGSIMYEALNAKKTYEKYVEYGNYLKEKIKDSEFLNEEGISLFISSKNPNKFSKQINEHIKLSNGKSIITKCPNQNRILKDGVVLEIKKLDLNYINIEILDEISNVINEISKQIH
ncbi:hypothetical protein [Methanococcus voltae]|uniref:DegT/DnrJ/EryC1/StrS aminotransferase n=1 Tax=Methanococcus voltae (strain ATCC BAA-1334 / A3) TaxID=456320 RepID=D7DV10_METV3|nr:hypothetical protein [Methanococcus voltae]MCS3900775.1 hypothetical protein [Methanococcus voltae]